MNGPDSKARISCAAPGTSPASPQLLDEYLALREAGVATGPRGTPSPGTLRNDREARAAIFRTGLARVVASRLQLRDVAEHRRRRTASAISVSRELRVLRATLRWAVEAGHLERVPVRLHGLTSTRRDAVPTVLPDSDLVKLLDTADPQLRLVLALCRYGGLRRGECLALRREDLGPDAIRIPAKPLGDGTWWRPKGRSARRVPIGARLRAEIDRAPLGDPWVFTNTRGARLRDVEERVRRCYLAVGPGAAGLPRPASILGV